MIIEKYFALGFLFAIEAIIFSVLAYLLYFYFRGLERKYIKYWAICLSALAFNQLILSIEYFFVEQLTSSTSQMILIFMRQMSQYLQE